MGGGKKTSKTTSTYTPPSWIESSAQTAAGMATSYAQKPYQAYTGERVAGLSANEQQGVGLAASSAGEWRGDMESARAGLDSVEKFTDADMEAYMNPYIKGALDPAAREIGEYGAKQENQLAGQQSSMGAFSGSRARLAMRDQQELTQQGISDLYGKGYAQAFDTGAALWSADQDRAIQQSSEYMRMAGLGSDLVSKDIHNLMTTGETARYVEQLGKDFDYQQFIEERDWEGKNAAYLTDVLRGLKGSYSETQTAKTEETEEGNVLGQVLGIAGAVVGFIYGGGPAGAVAGYEIGSSVGGA